MREYAQFDGIGLAQLIARGEVSASEVTEAAINAIESLNPQLNAVTITNFDNARNALGQNNESALAYVPFLLKDVNVFSHDMPTTFSSAFFADARPRPDSEIVTRWRNAGLSILGKTNTPEFAEDYVCEPTFRGATLNPWNTGLTTGGSSGGAGAAVASGMVPIAHGTDLGGSIRIPAACCGVFGFKPSAGLSPVDASLPEISNGFNSDHVLTRSVRDSAASLDITAGHAHGYRYCLESRSGQYLASLDAPTGKLKVGVCCHTPTGELAGTRQQQAVEMAAALLVDAGHELIEYRYPTDLDIGDWLETLWMPDVVSEINQRVAELGREPRDYELESLTRFLRGLVANMGAIDLYHARRRAHCTSVTLMQSIADYDLLLTPALARDPIPLGALDSRTDAFDYEQWSADGYAFAPFSYVCNMTGQPAAAIPVFLQDGGMPCSVQLAGHSSQDQLVLQVCRVLEQSLDWHGKHPPIWSGHTDSAR
ncbi:MAG: amidase [Pseudomonadota bacterium]